MFGGKTNKTRAPIGVAVTPTGVYLAQVDRAGAPGTPGAYTLAASASALLPAGITPSDTGYDDELARTVTTALMSADFKGRAAVSAMPAESLNYKNIRLPQMPDTDLSKAVAWEAKERAAPGVPTANQFYHAGEVHQGQDTRCEIILLSAQQAQVDAHIRGLTQAKLRPVAIDATAAALARATALSDETHCILHLGDRTIEAVIAQGPRVLFNKLIPAEDIGPNADNLAREIGLCLRYHSVTFRGNKPGRVLLAGQPAPEPLLAAVRETLAVEVSPLHNPFNGTAAEPLGAFAAAAGLSLRDTPAQAKRGAA